MNIKHLSLALVAVAACLLCNPSAVAKKKGPPGAGAAYTIVTFMPPGSTADESWVNDLNEVGQAVGGLRFADGTTQAVHLDLDTGQYSLLAGGTNSIAAGINNLNQIVGTVGGQPAFWESPSALPVLLPGVPGNDATWTRRINDAGIVTGNSNDSAGQKIAAVWSVIVDNSGATHIDGPLPLVPLTGDLESAGTNLNEVVGGAAQVVGESKFHSEADAVLWTVSQNADGTLAMAGLPQTIGTLGLGNPSTSKGRGINNLGDTCGISDDLPFVALAGGQPTALSVPRRTAWGVALAVNDLGEIVGEAHPELKRNQTIPSPPKAYLWRDGDRIELQRQIDSGSGWDQLWGANNINNAGVIAGQGKRSGAFRGFLMIPNPS